MTRIYISERGSDRNDGLTRETAIYSWKRARRLSTRYVEVHTDSPATRKRLMQEDVRVKAKAKEGLNEKPRTGGAEL
jgi:hypothetical protein